MAEGRKALTRGDYEEISGCLERALAVFARSSRTLSAPESRVRHMLTALLAEIQLATGPARPAAPGESPAEPPTAGR